MGNAFLVIFIFLLGAAVGGFVVYKNIDVVVQERYRKHRQSHRDEDDF